MSGSLFLATGAALRLRKKKRKSRGWANKERRESPQHNTRKPGRLMEPRSFFGSLFAVHDRDAKKKREESEPTATRSALLAEIQGMTQPVSLCSPQNYHARYWFDLNEQLFARKGLETKSRTFHTRIATDDMVVFDGQTVKGEQWRTEIRRNNRTHKHKYLADVHVGDVHDPDLIVYATRIDAAPASSRPDTLTEKLRLRRPGNEGRHDLDM